MKPLVPLYCRQLFLLAQAAQQKRRAACLRETEPGKVDGRNNNNNNKSSNVPILGYSCNIIRQYTMTITQSTPEKVTRRRRRAWRRRRRCRTTSAVLALMLSSFVAAAMLVAPTRSTLFDDKSSCYQAITFSEFPPRSSVTTQYQILGVHFESASGGGSSSSSPAPPYIASDPLNPNSPVLASSSPSFRGTLVGKFVDPSTGSPTVVEAFAVDIGSFEEYGYVRLAWFDIDGRNVGQRINTKLGYETFVVDVAPKGEGSLVAGFSVEVVAGVTAASFSIDNLISCPYRSSVVFRQLFEDNKDGTWGTAQDGLTSGFDHVALTSSDQKVYESHPKYKGGAYISADATDFAIVDGSVRGPQQQFSVPTFDHYSPFMKSSPVLKVTHVPIPAAKADAVRSIMESNILTIPSKGYRFPDFSGLEAIMRTLAPESQKGGADHSYTNVGFLEKAAEDAGVNNGEGFVPDDLEAIVGTTPTGQRVVLPLLSPHLMYEYMRAESTIRNWKTVVKGWFHNCDYVVIDPIGRKLGHRNGVSYDEIPLAFRTEGGPVEFFVIPDRLPGIYTLDVYGVQSLPGLGAIEALGAIDGTSIQVTGGDGDHFTLTVQAPEISGSKCDVDGDGAITSSDRDLLVRRLGRFAKSLDDAGDFSGDGIYTNDDVVQFDKLVGQYPIAQPDAFILNQNIRFTSATSILENDNGATAAILLEQPKHGTAIIDESGYVSYTPEVDFCGADSLVYKALNEKRIASSVATVVLTVKCVNDPVAHDDTYNTGALDQLVIDAASGLISNDVGASALAVISHTNPIGDVTVSDQGDFTYIPKPLIGKDVFEYTVEDREGNTATARVTINVGDRICYEPITFNEFPHGTSVTTQYEAVGIQFGGDSPLIASDPWSPTSPVLSGWPLFEGSIDGSFVNPETRQPSSVGAFALDAGSFKEFGKVRLQWFNADRSVIGQITNTDLNYERLIVDGGNIASFKVDVFNGYQGGYSIDNLVSCPAGRDSLVFREMERSQKDSSWGGVVTDDTAGFDHVGLSYEGKVYECHPGYRGGTYRSVDDVETVAVSSISGPQQQFTDKTFSHASIFSSSTHVIRTWNVAIDASEARAIKQEIMNIMKTSRGYHYVDFSSFRSVSSTLLPWAQKGGSNKHFTNVGLIEAAAERVGINGGNGLIPNNLESVSVAGNILSLLSPQFLYEYLTNKSKAKDWSNAIKGWMFNSDYILTDPLGRRLGYYDGNVYDEIPLVFKSSKSRVGFFVVADRVPGQYTLELLGTNNDLGFGAVDVVGVPLAADSTTVHSVGETSITSVDVQPSSNGKCDLNGDGRLAKDDRDVLVARLGYFTDGLDDPGDINNDGVLDATDVQLFESLTGLFPGAYDDTYSTQFNETLLVSASNGIFGNDIPSLGDTLVFVSNTDPAYGTLLINPEDGSFEYVPNLGSCDSDEFQYTTQEIKSGVTYTASVRVQMVDSISPTVSCKQRTSVLAGQPFPNLVQSSDDNCGVTSITRSEDIAPEAPGKFRVTVTAKDAAGNIDRCVATVMVRSITTKIRAQCREIGGWCRYDHCCGGLKCKKMRSLKGKLVFRCVTAPKKECRNAGDLCTSTRCCNGLNCVKVGVNSAGKDVKRCKQPGRRKVCLMNFVPCGKGKPACCSPLKCLRKTGWSGPRCVLGNK